MRLLILLVVIFALSACENEDGWYRIQRYAQEFDLSAFSSPILPPTPFPSMPTSEPTEIVPLHTPNPNPTSEPSE